MEHVAAVDASVDSIVRQYRGFADGYAQGAAPAYARIARALVGDEHVLGLVASLPAGNKRQPNLLLGAVRFLGGPVGEWADFRAWLLEHWEQVRAVVLERYTQTNEVRRCATLLPVLAGLEGPLALVEVGASAGLCLYPDRYRYSFDGGAPIGPARSPVLLECATSGPVPVPGRVPRVVWRAGIDLNPLDVRREEDVRWLEALVWPGPYEAERRERLRAAARVVAAEPPLLVAGDLVRELEAVAARVPAGARLVVMHSAVLAYLDEASRDAFVEAVRGLEGHWVSNEGASVLPALEGPRPPVGTDFALALDGRVVAFAGEHGQRLTWAG
ncbi:DUF2332 domain-containing protein [Nocardiopsis dassonvillei]|uniref:DUF2332 domain-containing protein n=1 Tax=Nocardiopsis dassonvillei (strain ATCC 23218 / DSM 43111 / CIP 107115 / JCM 7437 / KCTC 9190 / NBRC 14626 / NCTC 10488 / NRRL B-5397 / IMRU 509) TaxID=446468 RepID=D7B6D0_NOCDD|nr:DUF2332 domain-containing protein [Nocardiopsis dassonvillei]ADH67395.1 protein of unknown function UCP012608 [Nocardiopsis dassonvillei subsp. dassonvillei DSM 43111]APC35604.1 hypothetical protein A9R04_13305 [Nocardiopsis dassonvillei]NKY77398.1 DUF2332 domain-containing protein [Nocardiopsis dassonvillei]VEI87542.1 Uncharacterized protein conserved in bacteria (DUF2332) [Nocardiopsis dassonvillei]